MGFKETEEVKTTKTEEKKIEEKKEEVKNRIVVVKELPMQPVRQSKDEKTGIITTYVTVEEALTNLLGGDL